MRNLITGTRYLNIEGMLPFENMVADYVKETGWTKQSETEFAGSSHEKITEEVFVKCEN